MNIRDARKSINNIGAILVIFLIIIIGVTLSLNLVLNKAIVNKYFTKIEDEEINTATHRTEKIFESQIDQLRAQTKDYALWDDIYNRVKEKNKDETWFRDNFTEYLPQNFDIDLVIVVNRDRNVIAGNKTDYIIMYDRKIAQTLIKDKYDEKAVVSGFKKYNGELYIISACPIFDSNYNGTCQGALVLGKKISPKYIQSINEKFGGNMFVTYDDKIIADSKIIDRVNKDIPIIHANRDKSLIRMGNNNIIGSLPIRDISGDDIGYIRIIESRNVFLSTKYIMYRNTLIVMLISISIVAVLGIWCKKIIVKSIKTLETQIKKWRMRTH